MANTEGDPPSIQVSRRNQYFVGFGGVGTLLAAGLQKFGIDKIAEFYNYVLEHGRTLLIALLQLIGVTARDAPPQKEAAQLPPPELRPIASASKRVASATPTAAAPQPVQPTSDIDRLLRQITGSRIQQ